MNEPALEVMVEFEAKRNAWYTYNSTLWQPDGTEVCSIDLQRWRDQATFSVNGVEYRVTHERLTSLWELIPADADVAVCRANKPKALQSRMIVDRLDDNGNTTRKVRMHPDGWTFNFIELSTQLTEEEAFEEHDGEQPFMSMSSGLHKKVFTGTAQSVEEDDVFFAFLFFIALITYRRKKREIERARREARARAAAAS